MLQHMNVYLAWVMNHSLLEGVHFTRVENLSLLMSAVWINTLFVSSISWCRGHRNDWGCVKWMLIINGSWPLHRLLVTQLNTFYNIWNKGRFLPLHTTMLSLGNRIRFSFIGVVFFVFSIQHISDFGINQVVVPPWARFCCRTLSSSPLSSAC